MSGKERHHNCGHGFHGNWDTATARAGGTTLAKRVVPPILILGTAVSTFP